MAGIGFELKKLYAKKGLFGTMRAVGYSTVVCVGPMLLGIMLLLGITILCTLFDKSGHDRELLVCMTTYNLLFSLIITSFFSMIITRFTADMLYSEHKETILPSFFGVNIITLAVGGVLYAIFLLFCGSKFINCVFCWCLFMELIVTWNAQSYLTALKEFRAILISYALAISISLALTAIFFWLGAETVPAALSGIGLGYGVMMIYDFVLIYRRFPDSNISPFMFLRWADKFNLLAYTGLFLTIGMFSHILIIWLGPIQVVVEGLWVGAPYYDVSALVSFLTILITTVGFVVSVEVNFYPKYREYYALFNDRGTISDIIRVEGEMLKVLKSEIWYTALKQLFFTAAVISLGEFLLGKLPLGFTDLMYGYFRTLCVGYGIYAVGNTVILLLLYFTDYEGAVKSAAVFAISSSVLTLISLFFSPNFYGFGFLLGSAIFFGYSIYRLDKYTRRLPYFVLSVQPMVSETKESTFSRLGMLLEKNVEKGLEEKLKNGIEKVKEKKNAK